MKPTVIVFTIVILVAALIGFAGQNAVEKGARRAKTPTPTPELVERPTLAVTPGNVAAFTASMRAVQAVFQRLANNTGLFTDAAWRSEADRALLSAESEAQRLNGSGSASSDAYGKIAEALRVIRESVADYDIAGMESGLRLLQSAPSGFR